MRIDHVAHPSRDPYETHRFYNGVLGLTLAQAYAGHELLLVYALPNGGSLAFSASRQPEPKPADYVLWERKHVGLTVFKRADYEYWLNRLKQAGVRHQVVDDERIYFADPDGLVLELEVASPAAVDPGASEVLARWASAKPAPE